MEDFKNQYPVGFYFSVSVDGSDINSFQEVSGISKEMDLEDVVGGSENQFKYRLPTGSSSKNLILKRGIVSKDSPLLRWCVDSIDGGLATPIQPKSISVYLLDQNGAVSMKWVFNSAYPVKYSVSDFKSQENEVLIETLELAYSYFQVDES